MDRIGNSPYSLHPSFALEETGKTNLLARTGKTFEQWVAITVRDGPSSLNEKQAWLKETHRFTTNYAWWVAERSEGRGAPEDYDPVHLVEVMFSGAKEPLVPIYKILLAIGLGLGEDVKACPCQTIVPLYRNRVFAQIKPATNKRIDLGLALGETAAQGRLIDTGGFAKKDRITHRIPITSLDEIDEDVRFWLQTAYDMDQ